MFSIDLDRIKLLITSLVSNLPLQVPSVQLARAMVYSFPSSPLQMDLCGASKFPFSIHYIENRASATGKRVKNMIDAVVQYPAHHCM